MAVFSTIYSVRRIPVQRLLDDKHQFTYNNLVSFTQDILCIESRSKLVFTYTDADGDVVTISSRAEFLEAWQHLGGDVLRLTAVVVKSAAVVEQKQKETQSEATASSFVANENGNLAPVTLQSILETVMAMIAKFIQTIQSNGNVSCSPPSNNNNSSNIGVNVMADSSVPLVATNEIVERIIAEMKNMKHARLEAWRAKSLITDPDKLDPSFVPWRHTCDGCGVSPIEGALIFILIFFILFCFGFHGDASDFWIF